MGSHGCHALVQLVDLFGSTRDEWIERDLDGWLAANEIYEGMPQVLEHLLQRHALYIVTTKQAGPSLPDSVLGMYHACVALICPSLQELVHALAVV